MHCLARGSMNSLSKFTFSSASQLIFAAMDSLERWHFFPGAPRSRRVRDGHFAGACLRCWLPRSPAAWTNFTRYLFPRAAQAFGTCLSIRWAASFSNWRSPSGSTGAKSILPNNLVFYDLCSPKSLYYVQVLSKISNSGRELLHLTRLSHSPHGGRNENLACDEGLVRDRY